MSCGFLEGERLVVTDEPLKDYQGKVVRIDRHKGLVTRCWRWSYSDGQDAGWAVVEKTGRARKIQTRIS